MAFADVAVGSDYALFIDIGNLIASIISWLCTSPGDASVSQIHRISLEKSNENGEMMRAALMVKDL